MNKKRGLCILLSATLAMFGNPFPGIVRAEETFDGPPGEETVWREEDDSAQQADSEIVTESVSLTEENRYDPELYKEPTVMYPGNSNGIMRISALTLEEYLVEKIRQLETEIDVSAYNIPRNDAWVEFNRIVNNHPEIFYLDRSIGSAWSNSEGYVTKYTLGYNDTAENIRKQRLKFDEAADQIVAQTTDSMSDVEKLLTVHDALILNCEYDKENLEANTVPEVSYTAYGALVNHTAVCQGYAEAYSYIVENRLGFSCDIVSSDEMNHAWNMVELDDGQWYHVDTTWDDPTWDSIGRVRHTYFLLSDAEISDEKHRHTGWDGTHEAVSNTYDMRFWTDVSSAFCYWNGEWYYSKYDSDAGQTSLLKQDTFLDNSSATVLYTESETWNRYLAGYMYLDMESDKLYFNDRDAIYRLDPDGTVREVYKPSIPEGQLIFGFTVQDGELRYALQENPNLNSRQVIERYALSELMLKEITGVSVENIQTVYDATPKRIIVEGIVDGDRVSYAGNDGIYRDEQPEMIDAGTYEVDYRVERDGCKTFYGAATIEIKKAVPEYSVPEGLAGSSGSKLGSVELPDGFVWQSDKGTKLFSEGTYPYYVSYIPADSDNFETVTDILVEVTVTCPGHVYHSQATAPGEETVTCALCGDSYKSTISVSPTELAFNERGQSQTVTATVAPEQAVTWESDNEAVATVRDGIVTAVSSGTANITARAGNKTATVKVTVDIKENPTQQPSGSTGGTGGNTGSAGSTGGNTGSAGSTGSAGGNTGSAGGTGSAGSTGGNTGSAGSAGGNTGSAGSTGGNTGSAGSVGSAGSTGGNTGSAGNTGGNTVGAGSAGNTGNTGSAGSAGGNAGGDTDGTGSTGNTGNTGDDSSVDKDNNTGKDSADKSDSSKQPQDTSDNTDQTQKPATATAYEKGDQIRDKATKAVYEVTKEASESGKGGTIAYAAPADKKASSVQIPKTVTLDGVTYKVTSVAANAFKNNKSLKKVTVGTNVTSIGGNAFYGCTKLKTVTIGSNVRTIGAKAFGGCTSLTRVVIPAKISSVGKRAFYNCKKLKSITIRTTKITAKTVGADAFKGISGKATIKVPAKAYSRYKKLLPKLGMNKKVKIVKL